MIHVIGVKKSLMVLGLVAVNILLCAVVYLYLQPQQAIEKQKLAQISTEVSTLRSDIARMQLEFEQIEAQKEEFQNLEKDGFFKDQSRRQAQDVFKAIQQKSGVNVAIANISAGKIEENEDAKKTNYNVLKSEVDLKIEAVNDVDIYHYLFLIEHYFPGHAAIESFNVKREADITGTVLRGIASGANPALVKADIKMLWRTMIPQGQVIEGGGQR